MRAIVLHDYFESAEGGGRLSLSLALNLNADLGYGFKVRNHPYFKAAPLFGREYSLGVFSRIPGWRQYRLARAFQKRTRFLVNYDLVIYSGFYAPLAVGNHSRGQNLYYCNTPPRFIYDERSFYMGQIPFWQRPVLFFLIRYLQPRYERAVSRMGTIIANSKNIRTRLQSYLGIDSEVVYPPCETDKYKWLSQEDYYLSTARLDPLKRVDVVVKAFSEMPEKKLIVVSSGPDMPNIKRLAEHADNIRIMGWVAEDVLADLMGKCIATLYIPKDEDFGLSPLESMAAGKPVIGVREGGLRETVIHKETGLLIKPDPCPNDLIEAVCWLDARKALDMRKRCEQQAMHFDTRAFLEKIRQVLAQCPIVPTT